MEDNFDFDFGEESLEQLIDEGASTPAEFFNSLLHELKHVEEQIGECLGIDQKSEEAAYLRGGIARELFPHIAPLLCVSCRKKIGCRCKK